MTVMVMKILDYLLIDEAFLGEAFLDRLCFDEIFLGEDFLNRAL